jgi:ribosomal protein S18 acetylase RimI-like enzyme
MVGHDGHRGWLYYLGVDPARQKSGRGRPLGAAAEAWVKDRGVPKAMLMVRPENGKVRAFYAALGYEEQERIVFARLLDGK